MDTLTELQELEEIYCEMYKDVHGVKARWYRAESVEQARRDLEALGAELDAVVFEELRAQEQAAERFAKLVVSVYKGDFERAVRHQHEAYNTNGDEGFLEYHMGLPYGFFEKCRI